MRGIAMCYFRSHKNRVPKYSQENFQYLRNREFVWTNPEERIEPLSLPRTIVVQAKKHDVGTRLHECARIESRRFINIDLNRGCCFAREQMEIFKCQYLLDILSASLRSVVRNRCNVRTYIRRLHFTIRSSALPLQRVLSSTEIPIPSLVAFFFRNDCSSRYWENEFQFHKDVPFLFSFLTMWNRGNK